MQMNTINIKYTLFCILLFTTVISYSQTLSIVSQEDLAPVLFAPVKLTPLNAPSGEQQFLTDTTGVIYIPSTLLNQPVRIITSALGYETVTDTTILTGNKMYYLKSKKLQLNEVVVTGQYSQNNSGQAVQLVKVIDRAKIQSMAAQNLRDVLSNEMNVRISQDNILGSNLNLQGISGQNVKILVDGIALTGRLNGNIDISQINLNNVAKIEIVEGPMSVNYGSDAIAGTINIITKKTQQETVSSSVSTYYESNGQYNVSGKLGFRNSKNSLIVTGGRNYFDGWRTQDAAFHTEKTSLADTNRYMDWKPKEQYFSTVNYLRQLHLKNSKFQIGYTGDYFHEHILNRGLPRLPYYETAFDDHYQTQRLINSIHLKGELKHDHLQAFMAYTHYQRTKNTYFRDLTTLDQLLTENESDQDTTLLKTFATRGSISTSKHPKLNYEIGYDITQEKSSGLRIKDHTQQIGDYALFASAEYKLVTKLLLRPGIRFIYNTSYPSPVVPSIHVRYELNKKQILRFSYARGFRSPSLKELYFYFVDINHYITGNEHLKAEQSHHFNVSTVSSRSFERAFVKLETSVFYNNIQKMISLAQLADMQYTYFNLDRVQTTGIQANVAYQFRQFKSMIGVATIGRSASLANTNELTSFLFSPEAKFNLSYEWQKAGITFSGFYKYTGKLPVYRMNEDQTIYKSKMGDYHTADASVSKSFCKKRISISGGVKNIANVRNVSGSTGGDAHTASSNTVVIGMGRTYFLKVDLNFASKQ